MEQHDHNQWTHAHVFDEGNRAGERGTQAVLVITAVMMVVEILAGWWFNSMALLADGWHMSSHALAIGLSAFAYVAARHYAHDRRFAFGTWKIEVLAGFASAIFLLGIAAVMVMASLERLAFPQPIRYTEAIVVAVLGLAVNVVCAVILGRAHHHEPGDESHGSHHHHDLNLKSAYLHVLTDAATSLLAIVALTGGMLLGWGWLDPVMGIVGAALVAFWAWGLTRETSVVLLDREMDRPIVEEVRRAIEQHGRWSGATQVADLHVWRVGRRRYAGLVSVVTDDRAVTPGAIKQVLQPFEELTHLTVEVNRRS